MGNKLYLILGFTEQGSHGLLSFLSSTGLAPVILTNPQAVVRASDVTSFVVGQTSNEQKIPYWIKVEAKQYSPTGYRPARGRQCMEHAELAIAVDENDNFITVVKWRGATEKPTAFDMTHLSGLPVLDFQLARSRSEPTPVKELN